MQVKLIGDAKAQYKRMNEPDLGRVTKAIEEMRYTQ